MLNLGKSKFTKTSKPKEGLCRWMAALALASASQVATAQTVVPTDAKPTCIVTKKEFNGWLASNGSVIPPDNLGFPKTTASPCTFFRWAEHMFLWVTSRPARGNRESYFFHSSPFYAVSPAEKDMRTFIAQDRSEPDQRKRASASISQRGPEDEAVLIDNIGVMHKILQVEGGRSPIAEKGGQKIEIGRIEIEPDKMPIFHDTHDNLIENPTLREIASGQLIELKPPPGNTIVSNGHLFLLDQLGDAVAAEPGQADDHVLMASGNRLIYDLIHVNDVYAYFLTGTKNQKLNLTMFPTNGQELEPVRKYARDHGLASFPDEKASIVELKSSWIELPDEKDYSHYIWVRADVPEFKHLSDTHWQQIGWRQGVKLAMVGMHVAFSVNGHPELIWATFEHVNNTPNAPYRYDTKQGKQPWSRRNCGNWLFSSGHAEPDPDHQRDCYGIRIHSCSGDQTVDANGMCIAANHSRMYMDGGDIYSYNSETIGPSDILRISPWGNSEFRPTPNTHLISIHNSIRDRLAGGDVRKNYTMVGAIWLDDSSLGSGGTDCTTSSAQGSTCAANSSMETFEQPSNCLYCHRGPKDMLGGISHVYKPLNPLFIDAPKSLIR